MRQPVLGVITALAREARPLFGRWGWQAASGRLVKSLALPGGTKAVCVCAGPGRANAQAAVRWLERRQAVLLTALGVAGGLAPRLQSGDLIIAQTVVEKAGQGRPLLRLPDPELLRQSAAILTAGGIGCRPGRIFSSEEPVLACSAKARHHRLHGGEAVDLESGGILQAAGEAMLPCLILRAICDPPDRQVTDVLAELPDPDGRVNASRLVRALARRPLLLKEMLRLRRDFNAALAALQQSWQLLIPFLEQTTAALASGRGLPGSNKKGPGSRTVKNIVFLDHPNFRRGVLWK